MLRVESLGATGRDGPVQRLAALPAAVREMHRAVLAAFLATGKAPHVIEHRSKQWHWAVASTAALAAHAGQDGPAATCVCPAITFHRSRVGAAEHLSKHPELVGEVLDQATAVQIARLTFAALLDDPAGSNRHSQPR